MGNISLIDNGFLLTEAQNSPKHVACLQVWDLPKGKGSAWLRRLLHCTVHQHSHSRHARWQTRRGTLYSAG